MVLSERNVDLWVGAGLLGLCGFVSWRTTFIKTGIGSSSYGPSFMPWMMVWLIALFAVILMIRALLRDPKASLQILMPHKRTLVTMVGFAVMMLAYAAAFLPIGYLPSTLVAFVIGMLLLGERSLLSVVVLPSVITAAVYLGFTQLLSVWLP